MTQYHLRPIRPDELPDLLHLYTHLHATDAPLPGEEKLQGVWQQLLGDPKMHCLVAECGGKLVGTCTMVIVPNLTRGARPYALIENVVVHADYRGRGVGKALMHHALNMAWSLNCYKVMLLTGQKRESVHRFYQKCGFEGGVKTGFVARAPT